MTPEKRYVLKEQSKIKSIDSVAAIVSEHRKQGKTSGLITGCFDVLHIGHINLFRMAKQRVDFLVVGVEKDESLKAKNPDRPINKLDWRCEVLAELTSVDLVFVNDVIVDFKPSIENDNLFGVLYERISPDYLITDPSTDKYWELKLKRAEKMGIGFLGLDSKKSISSTEIINKLSK